MRRRTLRAILAGFLTVCLAVPLAQSQAQAQTTLRVGVQPGLTYLPYAVVAQAKLIEAAAKDSGLGEVTVNWRSFV